MRSTTMSFLRFIHLLLIGTLLAASTNASPMQGKFNFGISLKILRNGLPVAHQALEDFELLKRISDEKLTPEEMARKDPLAPKHVQCPAGPLTQSASELPAEERAYFKQRKPIADEALQTWLASTGLDFGNTTGITYPTIALAVSGGSYRSMLTGAGVYQALDVREKDMTKSSLAGLRQALSYDAGLSGGGWLLASVAGNGWPTITEVMNRLWFRTISSSFAQMDSDWIKNLGSVIMTKFHVLAKRGSHLAVPTLPDVTGWLLAQQFLYPEPEKQEEIAQTWSGLRDLKPFHDHTVPIPIITAVGTKAYAFECPPSNDSTQYEFTPFTFGSFDPSIAAFAPMKYLGSRPSSTGTTCVNSFDTTAFVIGTTSNLFGIACAWDHGWKIPGYEQNTRDLIDKAGMLLAPSGVNYQATSEAQKAKDIYATIPNPFFDASAGSDTEKAQQDLTLVDSGEIQRHDPLWPFLHRPHVDVLFVSDNSGSEVSVMAMASQSGASKDSGSGSGLQKREESGKPKRGLGGLFRGGRGRGSGGIFGGGDSKPPPVYTTDEYPTGGPLRRTYAAAVRAGLGGRMPFIPNEDVFKSQNMNKRPVIFGCPASAFGSTNGTNPDPSKHDLVNLATDAFGTSPAPNKREFTSLTTRDSTNGTNPDQKKLMIVRLPNQEYSSPSGWATEKLEYKEEEIKAMVANGVQIATKGGDQRWPKCLACLLMAGREGVSVPQECEGCGEEYCYRE